MTLNDDPLGRLYQTAGASTTRMAYDGQSLIAEYNGSNTLLRRYVHGPGVDEPLVWYEGSGTSTRRWFHADERGSIVATSDGSGAMSAINTYDEHGIPGSSNSGRFQYTGQAWLPELGMYYYRARIYSPTLGRFMQTDPIGFGGGMNLYAYVGNDPVNFTDPSGMCRVVDVGYGWYSPSGEYYGPAPGSYRILQDCEGGFEFGSGGGATLFDGGVTEGGGGGGGGAGPSNPQQPRPLTPEERRNCAVAVMGTSGGIVAALMGYVEVAWALAGGAGRGARVGRVFGGPGMAVGGIIGTIMGYATYRAGEEARINQICRGLG